MQKMLRCSGVEEGTKPQHCHWFHPYFSLPSPSTLTLFILSFSLFLQFQSMYGLVVSYRGKWGVRYFNYECRTRKAGLHVPSSSLASLLSPRHYLATSPLPKPIKLAKRHVRRELTDVMSCLTSRANWVGLYAWEEGKREKERVNGRKRTGETRWRRREEAKQTSDLGDVCVALLSYEILHQAGHVTATRDTIGQPLKRFINLPTMLYQVYMPGYIWNSSTGFCCRSPALKLWLIDCR